MDDIPRTVQAAKDCLAEFQHSISLDADLEAKLVTNHWVTIQRRREVPERARAVASGQP
jgi:hypothetical protein